MTTLARGRHQAAARPTTAQLFAAQLAYALRDLWRTRVVFIFTFLFPLTFLVVIGFIVGNDTVGPGSGVRVMQYVTPGAAVMGALYGSFPTIASSLADARERGLLKRMRGTPLPGWIYLAGRIGAAVLFALGSLALMLVVGVAAYGVRIQWSTLPATVATVLLAVTAFAAAGVAVAGLARTAALAQVGSIAVAVVLSFLSGVMGYGDMPSWADRIAGVFPLKPFHDALSEQFDPLAVGPGWDVGALSVLAVWAVGGAVVATLTFRWEPVPGRQAAPARKGGPRHDHTGPLPAPEGRPALRAVDHGRPSGPALLWMQVRWATTAALRDPGWVFFAVAMPVGLYAFNAMVIPDAGADTQPPLGLRYAAGMIAWAATVNGMINMPEAFAQARERGVLKRLRGSPLPLGLHLAGRFVSALAIVVVAAALVLVTGILWFDLAIAPGGLALATAMLVLGTATLTACGFLLVSALPSSKAVIAVGLGVALPAAFFSDVFAIGVVPGWMTNVGSFLPLKHVAGSVSLALDPAGPSVSWLSAAVLGAWLAAATTLGLRLLQRKWE